MNRFLHSLPELRKTIFKIKVCSIFGTCADDVQTNKPCDLVLTYIPKPSVMHWKNLLLNIHQKAEQNGFSLTRQNCPKITRLRCVIKWRKRTARARLQFAVHNATHRCSVNWTEKGCMRAFGCKSTRPTGETPALSLTTHRNAAVVVASSEAGCRTNAGAASRRRAGGAL